MYGQNGGTKKNRKTEFPFEISEHKASVKWTGAVYKTLSYRNIVIAATLAGEPYGSSDQTYPLMGLQVDTAIPSQAHGR